MLALLVLHLVGGAVLAVTGGGLGRRSAWVALVAPIATLGWLASHLGAVLDGRPVTAHVTWLPGLGVGLDLRLDGLAALMLVLVAGVGLLVFAYAASYLDDGPEAARLMGLLVVFAGAMVGLVLADDLLVLYGFWELTSITSFLLIAIDPGRARARAAALHALLLTGAGALAMLGGFLVLGRESGTYRLSGLLADPPTGTAVSVALALVLLGAFTKSAQYPFHSWLPGAMVAPTPVSAYLHSATMVTAGVYLVARLSPAFASSVGWWRPVVVGVGLFTMVAGGLRAARQHDLKLLLAHGTVSQLGFLMAVFGVGSPEAAAAGATLLLAHGAFKATNFLVVGIVDHQFGTRDHRRLPPLDRSWAPVAVAGVAGAASMAGVPLLFGFVAKEAMLDAFVGAGGGWWLVAVAAAVVGSATTVAYSARFAWGLLGRDPSPGVAVLAVRPSDVRPGLGLVAPALVLSAVTGLLGVAPGLADSLVAAADLALHPTAHPEHLALWHGFNAPSPSPRWPWRRARPGSPGAAPWTGPWRWGPACPTGAGPTWACSAP